MRTLALVLLLGCGGGEATEAPAQPEEPRPARDAGAVLDATAPVVEGGPDVAAEAAAPCVPDWSPGTERTITLPHGGRERTYLLHVGRSVKKDPALVVNFHGLNNSPRIQMGFSGMSALADERGFVVVYPQGVSASFNAGGCCGAAAQDGIDDVGFARAIVGDVAMHACIDRRKVYATGFSNGGFMSYRLGCEAADLFAGIAPVAGASAVTSCHPSRLLPVIALHGTADTVVGYESDRRSIEQWVARNQCTGDPVRTNYGNSYCDAWTACAAKVTFCTVSGGAHLWPGSASSIPASPAILSFFQIE